MLGTDHSVFHQGINEVAVAMGLNPFSTPATKHPQFTVTTTADFNLGLLSSVTAATVADALVRVRAAPSLCAWCLVPCADKLGSLLPGCGLHV